MNYLQFYTGGHPFQIDDLIHLQSAQQEALRGIMQAFDESGTICLVGCEIVIGSPTTSWSAGFISYQSEIFYVDAGSFLTGVGTLFWAIEETTLSPSPVTYQDANSQNVHQQRRMTLKYFVLGDVGVYNTSLNRLPNLYGELVAINSAIDTLQNDVATNTSAITTVSGRVDSHEAGWIHSVPTITCSGTMTFTYSSGHISYKLIGKTMLINVNITGTIGGVVDQVVYVKLPNTLIHNHTRTYTSPVFVFSGGVNEIGIAQNAGAGHNQISFTNNPLTNFVLGAVVLQGQITIELA